MRIHPFASLAASLCLASCAGDKGNDPSTAAAPAHKSMNERMNENNGYAQDAEGNWKPRTDKRSPFESQGESTYFKKDFQKKEYQTGDYTKKSWWGNKTYDRQAYTGKTDGSRFQKASAQQGKGAREATTQGDFQQSYETGNYGTGAAREAGAQPIAKGSNDNIENRRKVAAQPEIVDWREQRAMTMDQSKGILGH